ncbi:MAG: hypothetical protein LKCHEGNO_03580 [Burkholderiaceae bacterium]|nr:hypothetical protein [Burkholderiaceae bacterium]
MLKYTVMADYGGAYAWVKPVDDTDHWVGGNCADTFGGMTNTWQGQHRISNELDLAFAQWQVQFEGTNASDGEAPACGWDDFHAQGMSLARRLQAELGDLAVVVYRPCCEDPRISLHTQRDCHARPTG